MVSDINRKRLSTPLKTLTGTRKIHCVKKVRTGVVTSRNLSCFCRACIEEDGDSRCENEVAAIVKPFQQHALVSDLELEVSGDVKEQKQNTRNRKGKKGIRKRTIIMTDLCESQDVKPNERQRKTRKTEESKEIVELSEPQQKNIKKDNGWEAAFSPQHTERANVFKHIIRRLNACKDFEEFVALSVQYKDDMLSFEIQGKPSELYVMQGHEVDEMSMDVAPSDLAGNIKYPIKIIGDGNCLPRCGSMLAFGNEDHHLEIRARIVVELALNETVYMNDEYLRRGVIGQGGKGKITNRYAMYSDQYVPGVHLTDNIVNIIYQSEVMKCAKLESFMGIWQIHALANVLKCPIMSCYPNFIASNLRNSLHRLIFPKEYDNTATPAHILWTTTRTDMVPANWTPNHFVLLAEIDEPADGALLHDVAQTDEPDNQRYVTDELFM